MRYRGKLVEWTPASHGVIVTDEGRRVYASATEFSRQFVPKIGTRVRFEIVKDVPDESQLASARNVVMVVT